MHGGRCVARSLAESLSSNIFTFRLSLLGCVSLLRGVHVLAVLTLTTAAQVPYHGIHFMTVAYNVAIKGCTLPIPADCPRAYGDLMQQCWQPDSHNRPTFQSTRQCVRGAWGWRVGVSGRGFAERMFSFMQMVCM